MTEFNKRGPGQESAPEMSACKELGELLDSEVSQVAAEVERARRILDEAVEVLSASFQTFGEVVRHQDGSSMKEDPERLKGALSDAVRAFQFEDIATQALDDALRSITYLRKVAEEVRTANDADELATRIREQHRRWDELRRKAVSQQNLDTGSVDLF